MKHTPPYTNYGLNQEVNLGTGWQTYEIEFTTADFSGQTTDVRFRFWFAGNAEDGDVFYLDAISLCKATPASTPNAPLLSSPDSAATGIGDSPLLAWRTTTGASSYGPQVSTASNFTSTVINQSGITDTSYAASGMSNNTTYYWRVDATNSAGTSAWHFAVHVDTPAVPTLSAPANGATGVSTSPSLCWSASSGATSYQVQVSLLSNFSTTVISQTGITDTSYSASNLDVDTTYYWRVNATNSGGTSSWSTVRNFKTALAALSVLANGSFEDGTDPWWFWDPSYGTFALGAAAPGQGSAGAEVSISSTSGGNLQLCQSGMTLEPYTQYTVKFWAYANTGDDMRVYLHQNGSPYASYGLWENPDLGTSWAEYQYTVSTPSFTDPPDSTTPTTDSRLRFWFSDDAADDDVYHIDSVSMCKAVQDTTPEEPLPELSVTPNRVQFVDDEAILFGGSLSSGMVASYAWYVDDVQVGTASELLQYFPLGEGEASKEVTVHLEIMDDQGRSDEKSVTIVVKRRPRSYYYLSDHLGTIRVTVRGGETMLVEDFETEQWLGTPWTLPQWTHAYGSGFRLYQGRLTHESTSPSLLVNQSAKELTDGIVGVDVQLNDTSATGVLVVRHKDSYYYGVEVHSDRINILKRRPWDSRVMATHQFSQVVSLYQSHRVQVTAEANKLSVHWNGTQVAAWEDNGTGYDAPLESGKVGFQHGGVGTQYGCRWDNLMVTTGVPGQVITAEDFDPWGMVLDGRSYVYGNPDQRYKFTGKERDAESGYDYFGARYYDSRIGRWMSVDPLAEVSPSVSPFLYTSNNPICFIDPTGMKDSTAQDGTFFPHILPEFLVVRDRPAMIRGGLTAVNLNGIGSTYVDRYFKPYLDRFVFQSDSRGVGLRFNYAYRDPKEQARLRARLGRVAAKRSLHSVGFAVDVKLSGLVSLRGQMTYSQKYDLVQEAGRIAGLESGANWSIPEPWHFQITPVGNLEALIQETYNDFLFSELTRNLTTWR